MEDLITIYRMNEVSIETRIKLIKELGHLINHQYASNITERLVVELCMLLDDKCGIDKEEHYASILRVKSV